MATEKGPWHEELVVELTRLTRGERQADQVMLIQCDTSWLLDDALGPTRRAIDDLLVEIMLLRRVRSVRRLVLYDLPSGEGGKGEHAVLTAQHQAWMRGLERDIAWSAVGPRVRRRRRDFSEPYEIKQIVLARATEEVRLPVDGTNLVGDFDRPGFQAWWDSRFVLWMNRPRVITGPKSDLDPRVHLDA